MSAVSQGLEPGVDPLPFSGCDRGGEVLSWLTVKAQSIMAAVTWPGLDVSVYPI